jgi:site-specific DNA-cytosine methylase
LTQIGFAFVHRTAEDAFGEHTLGLTAPTDHDIFHDNMYRRGVSLDPVEWVAHLLAVEAGMPRDWERFPFVAVDLFAGAGGSSTGIVRALKKLRVPCLLVQINHWSTAVATQVLNFPNAIHFNASVETPDPVSVIPWKHVDMLSASPECVSYSSARGKNVKIREQSRSSAAYLLTWLERVNVVRFAFENVREWKTRWGRMNAAGTATKRGYEGEYYRSFQRRLKKLGYARVVDPLLNASTYGAATSRIRLFVFAHKHRPVNIPAPTHTPFPKKYPHLKPVRTARQVIDFTDLGESSFFRRDKYGNPDGPHAINSLRRTMAGYLRQIPERPGAAAYARAFELYIQLAAAYHEATPPTEKKLEKAKLDVANAWRRRYGFPEREVTLAKRRKERAAILERSAAEWRERYGLLGTKQLAAAERKKIKTINVARLHEETKALFDWRKPVAVFRSEDLQNSSVDATLLSQHSFGGDGIESLDDPMSTIVAVDRHGLNLPQISPTGAIAEASIIRANAGTTTTYDDIAVGVDKPFGSLTGTESKAIAMPLMPEPMVMGQHGDSIARSVDESPVMTAASAGAISIQTPLADSQLTCVGHGEGDLRHVKIDEPIPTSTARLNVGMSTPLAEQTAIREEPALRTLADDGIVSFYSKKDRGGVEATAGNIDGPFGAITAGGNHDALYQPQAAIADAGLVSKHFTWNENPSIDAPLPTTDTAGAGYVTMPAIAEASIVSHHSQQEGVCRGRSIDEPIPTATAEGGGYVSIPAIAEASIISRNSDHGNDCRAHSVDETMPTGTARGAGYVTQPAIEGLDADAFLYEPFGERDGQALRVHALDKPTHTITSRGGDVLVQPTTTIQDVDYKPKILVDDKLLVLDSLFRMIRPRELSRAMSLVDEQRGYDFLFSSENSSDITRMIGNAVAPDVMEAITYELCSDIVGLPEDVPLMDVLIGPIPMPAVGDRYGIYEERVVRSEVGNEKTELPAWFKPREVPTHLAVHAPDGTVTFLELERNAESRAAYHPYEIAVIGENDEPTKITLFGEETELVAA